MLSNLSCTKKKEKLLRVEDRLYIVRGDDVEGPVAFYARVINFKVESALVSAVLNYEHI